MDEQIIVAIGSDRAPILVKLNTFNGRRSLDVRRYFYARDARELKPTQKGVGLNREAFAILKNALEQNGETIQNWLDTEDTDSVNIARRDHAEQLAAIGNSRTGSRPHFTDNEFWKSSTFFDVKAEGAIDHLTYNQSHNFKKHLDCLRDSSADLIGQEDQRRVFRQIEELLERLLLAYHRSKMLFDHSQQMSAADIFETLELNWGAMLEAYIASEFVK